MQHRFALPVCVLCLCVVLLFLPRSCSLCLAHLVASFTLLSFLWPGSVVLSLTLILFPVLSAFSAFALRWSCFATTAYECATDTLLSALFSPLQAEKLEVAIAAYSRTRKQIDRLECELAKLSILSVNDAQDTATRVSLGLASVSPNQCSSSSSSSSYTSSSSSNRTYTGVSQHHKGSIPSASIQCLLSFPAFLILRDIYGVMRDINYYACNVLR